MEVDKELKRRKSRMIEIVAKQIQKDTKNMSDHKVSGMFSMRSRESSSDGAIELVEQTQ